MTTPMTSREAPQDALDEWARANLPTESAGCITSWSDWIAAFVCDGVFGDSQMHPLSDIRDLDEVVRELGIQDSSTTPAEAVRELNAEIERLRGLAQTQSMERDFCLWLKGYFGGITGRDELTPFEANTIRANLAALEQPALISVSDEGKTVFEHRCQNCGDLHSDSGTFCGMCREMGCSVSSTDQGGT